MAAAQPAAYAFIHNGGRWRSRTRTIAGATSGLMHKNRDCSRLSSKPMALTSTSLAAIGSALFAWAALALIRLHGS